MSLYSRKFFCVPIACFILIYHLSLLHLYIFHSIVGRPFKLINHALEPNYSFLIELNFLSFLSLCVFLLAHQENLPIYGTCTTGNLKRLSTIIIYIYIYIYIYMRYIYTRVAVQSWL